MNKSASRTPVQGPSTDTTTSPLTSSAPYSGLRLVTSINLRTEFLLQFRKRQEDSAILLASKRPQQQGLNK